MCEDLDEELNPPDALPGQPRMAGVMLKQESGGREHWQEQSGVMRRPVSTTRCLLTFGLIIFDGQMTHCLTMLLHLQNTSIGCVGVCSMQEHCIKWEESRTSGELGVMVLFLL